MADLSVTAASVAKLAGSISLVGTAGTSITAGQVLYLDGNNQLQKALNDTTTHAGAVGIALDNAASGQPCSYLTSGDINPGATLAVGQTYVCSANAGGIAPISDLSTGYYVTHLGIATSASDLSVLIRVSNTAHA